MTSVFFHPISPLNEFQRIKGFSDLNKEEKKNILSFKYSGHQNRKILSRIFVKKSLATFLDMEPRSLLIKRDACNRPFLDNKDLGYSVDFNLSYSGDWMVLVVSDKGRVGVDIERIKQFDLKEVSSLVFNQKEISFVNSQDNKMNSFYQIWTLKESFLKACGKGLLSGPALSKICFSISNGEIKLETPKFTNWQFKFIDFTDDHQVSLCSEIDGEFKVNYYKDPVL